MNETPIEYEMDALSEELDEVQLRTVARIVQAARRQGYLDGLERGAAIAGKLADTKRPPDWHPAVETAYRVCERAIRAEKEK